MEMKPKKEKIVILEMSDRFHVDLLNCTTFNKILFPKKTLGILCE